MVLIELIFKFPLWVGVVDLKELIFNSFYLWGGCGCLERTDFNSFYVGRMWWS